MMRDLVSLF